MVPACFFNGLLPFEVKAVKVLYVSGYKSLEMGIFKEDDPKVYFIKAAIEKRIKEFVEEGLEWVIISGQMGVELWAAEIVLDLKETYDINLAVFPPFENQDKRWPENLQEKYQELIMTADFYKPLYKGDYKGPFQFRAKNMWFIDKSDAALLLMDEEFPGSVRYFQTAVEESEKDYPVYLITALDLDDIVEEIQMSDPNYWSN